MGSADVIRLLLLATMWSVSFLFMRLAAPGFGPVTLIFVRVGLASVCLAPLLARREIREEVIRHKWGMLVVGIFNSAVPFSLLAYATLSIESGFTSLLNATVPIFTGIIGALWLGTRLRKPQVIGLALAILGVGLLGAGRLSFKPGGSGWAIVAALAAACSYGGAANFTKRYLTGVSARALCVGSMIGATLVLLIPGLLLWPRINPSATAWGCAVGLAVLCTAIAYTLYFIILNNTGPNAATTVTFVVPCFAVLWGAVLLHERLTPNMMAGMAVTLAGTALTIGLFPVRRVVPVS